MRLLNSVALAAFFSVLVFSAGCTRQSDQASIRISIPASQSNGALSTEKLSTVILNIQIPGRPLPLVREQEFEDSSVAIGDSFEMVVEDIPAGDGYLIQLLCIYEDESNGAMKFHYGDVAAKVAGPTTVSVTTANVGATTKMAEINGRYLTSASGGPTGTLIAKFAPPGGKPKMSVKKMGIVNGWFSAFAIDSSAFGFDIELAETGELLFTDLKVSSAVLTPSAQVLKVQKPVTFHKDGGGDQRASPPTDMYLGFFGPFASGKSACYANMQEGVPMLYADASLSSVVKYNGSGSPGATELGPVGGGGVSNSSDLFLGQGNAVCEGSSRDSGDAVWFYHNKANQGDRDFGGFNAPFQMVQPFNIHGGYMSGKYVSATPKWEIKWKYLPGAATVLSGAEVWVKEHSGGGDDGGGGRDETCAALANEGFSLAGTVASPAESFDFTGLPGVPLNNSNKHNYRFNVCAFRLVAGQKRYVGDYIRSDCMSGGCGSLEHFGWGTTDVTLMQNETFTSAAIGGAHSRISAVTPAADYNQLTLGDSSGFVAGDEVMLLVSGMASSGDCGQQYGDDIQVGMTDFARVLYASAGILKISSGNMADELDNTYLASTSTAANFCYVQAVKIPHFRNIDLAGFAILGEPFNYVGEGGGIVALRASNEFSFNGGALNLSSKGYEGGMNSSVNGAGHRSGASFSPTGSNMGGEAFSVTEFAGGGGYGSGGAAGANAMGGSGQNWDQRGTRFFMGGGGAGSGGNQGGGGGGIAFVTAHSVAAAGAVGEIFVDGGNGITDAGGGGGGSAMLYTRSLSGLGINIYAYGGSGGALSSATGTGGGGGGFQNITACNNSIAPASIFANTGGGSSGGAGSPGSGGGLTGLGDPSDWWICR